MRLLARISVLVLLMGAGTGLLALQRGGYAQEDQYGNAREAFTGGADDPNAKSEYSWSRLRYTTAGRSSGGYGYYGGGNWSRDYPKADRQFLIALRRLTRIQARPTEQVVDLDKLDATGSPEIYQLSMGLRRPSAHVDVHRARSQTPTRLFAQGRFPDGR